MTLHIHRLGNRRGESERLPATLWTLTATIEAGGWAVSHSLEAITGPTDLRIRPGNRG